MSQVVAIILMCYFAFATGARMVKHDLTDYPLALCNDGTQANYYMEENCNEKSKMMVYLQGGGRCDPGIDCHERCDGGNPLCTAITNPFINMDKAIFSDDPEENIAMHDFCKVYVHYCSSDLFCGAAAPSATNEGFYFHGFHIVDAVFEDLLLTLKEKMQVVFIGTSAGAEGINRNCDFVADKIHAQNQNVDVRCVVDSAIDFVPDHQMPEWCDSAQYFHTLINDGYEGHGDESCYMINGEHAFECTNYVTYYPYVETPIFNAISEWDSVVHIMASCQSHPLNDEEFWHEWRVGVVDFARKVLAEKPKDGVFLLNCPIHVLSMAPDVYNSWLVLSDPDDGGNIKDLSYSRILANWLQDTAPFVAIDDPDTKNIYCDRK